MKPFGVSALFPPVDCFGWVTEGHMAHENPVPLIPRWSLGEGKKGHPPPSRPNKVGLKCVRPSTKRFFNFNEIWYICRGRRAMNEGMQHDPLQGQGHEPLKAGNSAISKGYLLPHLQWGLANDHEFLN